LFEVVVETSEVTLHCPEERGAIDVVHLGTLCEVREIPYEESILLSHNAVAIKIFLVVSQHEFEVVRLVQVETISSVNVQRAVAIFPAPFAEAVDTRCLNFETIGCDVLKLVVAVGA